MAGEPAVEQWEVDWTRGLWETLRDRGVGGVPRAGVVFQKREAEREFAVVARMPYEEGMPLTAKQLAEQQQSEIDGIRLRLAVAGISVPEHDKREEQQP